MPDPYKTCTRCHQTLPLSAFYAHPRARDGRRGDCKSCVLAARKARYAAEPELLRERQRVYRQRRLARAQT